MRRVVIVAAFLVACLVAPAAHAAVSVADLQANDVVFDAGVTRSAEDRARLQSAADELRAKAFPTKFVVVSTGPKSLDKVAFDLRAGLAKKIGVDNIDAVLVLGNRQLGINADVFQSERDQAFQAEIDTLRSDDIAGTINVANRLQAFDEAGALPGDKPAKSDGGISAWIIALIVVAGIAVIAGAFLARRAAKRGAAAAREAE
jgi:hypothetical protein